MQRVEKLGSNWVFYCQSTKHGGELVSPGYATKQQAEHMLAEHNKRQHNK